MDDETMPEADVLSPEERAYRAQRAAVDPKFHPEIQDQLVEDAPGQVDYFGELQTDRVYLPDRTSWIEFKALNEGERRAYQNSTSRDIRMNQRTSEAKFRPTVGDDRAELLKLCITDWNLAKRRDSRDKTQPLEPFPFSKRNMDLFLAEFPPKVIDLIEKAVRKANPWTLQDLDLEDMLTERDSLDEMIELKRKELAGKAD